MTLLDPRYTPSRRKDAMALLVTAIVSYLPLIQQLPLWATLPLLGAVYLVVGIALRILTHWFNQRANRETLSKVAGLPEEGIMGAVMHVTRNTKKRWDWLLSTYDSLCPGDSKQTFVILTSPLLPGQPNDIRTRDPRNVEHILKGNFNNYIKSPPEPSIRDVMAANWLGKGIFTVDHGPHSRTPYDGGKTWYTQHGTAARIFTAANFKSFYLSVFLENSQSLMSTLQAAAASGEAFDIQHSMFAYTMDSFGKIAFGVELGNLSGKDRGFGDAFDGSHAMVFKFIYGNIRNFLIRGVLPSPFGEMFDHGVIRKCEYFQSFLRHNEVLNKYIYNVIEERRKNPDLGRTSDLLGLFMNSDEGTNYTKKELRDIVMNFIIAGRDTTACTLSWLWYELAQPQNKEVQRKLIEEVDAMLQGEEPDYDLLMKQMPYLRAVIWEVLRLHPIVPHTGLIAVEEDQLPDGTPVPAGSRVWYDTFSMCRNPKVWGEDCMALKPERWIPFKQPSNYEFPVFKGGPRLCLGMNMAIFEASLVAATVLQKYRFEVVPGCEYGYTFTATMAVKNLTADKAELRVRVIERERA